MPKSKQKLIVILGPTASGKTEMSVKLAKKFKGEIISADSRQVYKGMDLGTGKISRKEMKGIPHYLLDVAEPKKRFDVVEYKKLAEKAVEKIFKKNKLPILVGGTGFYIQSIVDNITIPEVKPDWKLRAKLEKKSVEELYQILVVKDPLRAKNIDKNNPRRLIRALEIVIKTGRSITPLSSERPSFGVLLLGVKKPENELKKLIALRLEKRLKQGMIKEVEKLHKKGLSWKRLDEFGLEYRSVAQYLQNKISYQGMTNNIQKESEHYIKRQMTWFKRDKRIKWIKDYKQAEKLTKSFISK